MYSGAIQAQIKAQIALLAASPHNLIVQLDSNSEWIPSDTRGTDFTGVFKELYRRCVCVCVCACMYGTV